MQLPRFMGDRVISHSRQMLGSSCCTRLPNFTNPYDREPVIFYPASCQVVLLLGPLWDGAAFFDLDTDRSGASSPPKRDAISAGLSCPKSDIPRMGVGRFGDCDCDIDILNCCAIDCCCWCMGMDC